MLKLVGVGENGTLSQTVWDLQGLASTTRSAPLDEHARAAELTPSGLVAGIGDSRVTWFRLREGQPVRLSSTPLTLAPALAAASSRRTNDLVVILADGRAERVALPSP